MTKLLLLNCPGEYFDERIEFWKYSGIFQNIGAVHILIKEDIFGTVLIMTVVFYRKNI